MAVLQYNLFATDGFISLPTNPEPCPRTVYSSMVYVFGFVGGLYSRDGVVVNPQFADTPENRRAFAGSAMIPSPRIDAEIGDRVYVQMVNIGTNRARRPLADPHTVHLHGMHVPTQLDGFPEQSFVIPVGQKAVYYFLAERAGTFMYHCHVEAAEHIQMGMYGALVVYPSVQSLADAGVEIPPGATNRNFAYNHASTYFDKDYVMLLSDLDSRWHQSVFLGRPFNAVDFKPDWWLVNGRAFPDTLRRHPLPGYESYVHVKTGQKFLLRMINMGYQVVPWHIHGWPFMIVGKDAHPRLLGEMGFTQTIGSGETWDLLFDATNKEPVYGNYIFNGQDGYPSLMSQVSPDWWADVPLEGFNCNPAVWNYGAHPNQFFPQFYPMHNHDDYKVTNNGVYPGGQLTYIQTDAP